MISFLLSLINITLLWGEMLKSELLGFEKYRLEDKPKLYYEFIKGDFFYMKNI